MLKWVGGLGVVPLIDGWCKVLAFPGSTARKTSMYSVLLETIICTSAYFIVEIFLFCEYTDLILLDSEALDNRDQSDNDKDFLTWFLNTNKSNVQRKNLDGTPGPTILCHLDQI